MESRRPSGSTINWRFKSHYLDLVGRLEHRPKYRTGLHRVVYPGGEIRKEISKPEKTITGGLEMEQPDDICGLERVISEV